MSDLLVNHIVGFPIRRLICLAGEGSSGSTCSDTYHGGSAFSAPETNALQGRITALLDIGYEITAFISIHCYSQLLLTPYGHTSTRPSDYQEMVRNLYLLHPCGSMAE